VPDFTKIIEYIEQILKLIFGDNVPGWILPAFGIILIILISLVLVWMILLFASNIMRISVKNFVPLFYNREEKRRNQRRGHFADYVEREIRRLNSQERWSDYRFAELEAEVEAEGRQHVFSLIPFVSRTRKGLWRESSLSRALQTSEERLILLEGEPGSGKSVALRHVALSLARLTSEHPRTNSVIPLYLNLKELRRNPEQSVDIELIQSFIMHSLNKLKDRDIEVFLEEEFDKGLSEGTWLFLFDSFDEIPEILGSTEVDKITRTYAEAICSFMGGMNQCRGIIASRQFRGPDLLGWPRFRVKDLSEQRRLALIRNADLSTQIERNIIRKLAEAPAEIRVMTRNPMFLGLLCDQVRSQGSFPQNTYDLLATHIENRLSHDETRITQRFKISIGKVRAGAENIAFCMAMDTNLGLSPRRSELHKALVRLGLEVDEDFDMLCEVLEYVKLARSEATDASATSSMTFTFSHRRFQEYFATCVVLRDLNKVSPRQLLTDGRWRETAVTLFQTQSLNNLNPILQEVRTLIQESISQLPYSIGDPMTYILDHEKRSTSKKSNQLQESGFMWAQNSLNVLDILQQGFARRITDIPDDIRLAAARLVITATVRGSIIDRKWALEVAGTVPSPVLMWLLQRTFPYNSRWLREVAYRQVSRLAEVSEDIANWIRNKLVDSALSGSLSQEQFETEAFLSRLPNATDFLATMRLLLWIPFVNVVSNICIILVLTIFYINGESQLIAGAFFILLFLLSVVIRKRYHFSHGLQRMPLFPSIMMVLIFVLVLSQTFFNELSPLLSLLYVCFLFWPAFAFSIAKEGQFSNPVWWLFYPVIYIIMMILRAPSAFIRFIRLLTIRGLLTLVAMFAGLGLFAFFLLSYSNQIKPYFFTGMVWFFAISFAYVFIILGRDFYFWFNDWKIWRIWYKCQINPITFEKLLESLNQYKRPVFYIRTVRFIRENGKLIPTENVVLQLQHLASAIERAQFMGSSRRSKRPKVVQLDDKIRDFHFIIEWLNRYKITDPNSLRELGPEFLDEVCILAEQMRLINNVGRMPINV
jgi:hypothetical protein